MPAVANKTTFSNVVHTTSGGSCEWLPHVDKLILEMLANRTPPTCIQANIFAMSRVLHSEIDIVRELPSVKHIKSLRTVLSTVKKRHWRHINWVMPKIGNSSIWMKCLDTKYQLSMW